MFYKIVVLDAEGFEMAVTNDIQPLTVAKDLATAYLSDLEYKDLAKVQILNARKKVIWEKIK